MAETNPMSTLPPPWKYATQAYGWSLVDKSVFDSILKSHGSEWAKALYTKEQLAAATAPLEARIAELEKDAARYRWLRQRTSSGYSMPGSPYELRLPRIQCEPTFGSVRDELDAFIDTAMKDHP